MKNCLISLIFFIGLVHMVLSVSRKYYLIQLAKTWNDAQTQCRAEHVDLAIVKDNEDMIQLQNEIQTQQFSSRAWIGLSVDTNSWRWSMGDEPLGSFRGWGNGEPNNWCGHEECASFVFYSWIDKSCMELFAFVCFDVRNTGNQRYIYINNLMTWSEAQAYCRQHHTDLASARDSAEDSIVKGLSSGYTWIGLVRDSWKWTDQTNLSTVSWISGQPDNLLGNENCGYLDNRQVGDALCSDVLPFFCYRDVTGQQQIVRVKVQSSEDINDPAVIVAILDQINQKLKETGLMGNFTLKWRKQSHGEVFHKESVEKNTTVDIKHCDLYISVTFK